MVHQPHVGLINALSLSYPSNPPAMTSKKLTVGKVHQTPSKGSTSPRMLAVGSPSDHLSVSPEAPKMSHREKYEALLAATTRPAPYVLSAGLEVGGIVRSDPISGKVSKGFWGPSREGQPWLFLPESLLTDAANFHLRPHFDIGSIPVTVHLDSRKPSIAIWGLATGTVVHTTIETKSHAAHGGRASSLNVVSSRVDSHAGEVTSIWAPNSSRNLEVPARWVTGGVDGLLKYWALSPRTSGNRSPAAEDQHNILCLFTSTPVTSGIPGRAPLLQRGSTSSSATIVFVRCDVDNDIVCSATADGDLRIFFQVTSDPQEHRLDVGSQEEQGPVLGVELDAQSPSRALVLVRHQKQPCLTGWIVTVGGSDAPDVETFVLETADAALITAAQTHFESTPPISFSPAPLASLSARIIDSASTLTPSHPTMNGPEPSSASSQPLFTASSDSGSRPLASRSPYGRLILGGDADGSAHIWSAANVQQTKTMPMRSWHAVKGKITALNMAVGLVAVAR